MRVSVMTSSIKPKVVAIIQARMGSTRLPGKALMDIHGRTMLARVVRRTRRFLLISEVIVATTTKKADEAILQECRQLDIPVFRGSEQDVLDRYYHAAKAFSADAIVRITSDCPLIDPEIIQKVVQAYLKGCADYASNTLARTYPRGLDVEVFSFWALEKAWRDASKDYEHVHVTPFIYQHPEKFRLLSVTADENLSFYRWTVDTEDDLNLVRAIYEELHMDDEFTWNDVLTMLKRKPELADINRHIRQKSLEEC